MNSLRDGVAASPLITFWPIGGRSLKKRPLHIPTSWLWKINPNHSSNLVPSERLPFFSHLFQTWQPARGALLSPAAGPWSSKVSCGLPSCELTFYLLTPPSASPTGRLDVKARWGGYLAGLMSERVSIEPPESRSDFGERGWECERLTLPHQHVNGLQSWIIELPPAITVVMADPVGI